MIIRELIAKLQGLPPDMEIFIDDGNSLTPVCGESGEVMSVAIGETIEPIDIFVIEPCACEIEAEPEDELFNLN